MKIFFLLSLFLFCSIALVSQESFNDPCAISQYRCTEMETKRAAFRKAKNYNAEDSLLTSEMASLSSLCPCNMKYANLVWRKVDLDFQIKNKRKEAIELLDFQIEECKEKNDSVILFLVGRKARYCLFDNDFVGMKKNLDAAIDLGTKKFDNTNVDLFKARDNLGIYYNWKNDYLTSFQVLSSNAKGIENVSFKDTTARRFNLIATITAAMGAGKEEWADPFKQKLIQLTKGSKYYDKAINDMNDIYFNYYLDKGDFKKAGYYYDQLTDNYFTLYDNAIPMIHYLISTGNDSLAYQKIIYFENQMNEYNVPPHQFFRINLNLKKLLLGDKYFNTDTIAKNLIISINSNYINLINESPKQLSSNVTLILSKYLTLIQLLSDGQKNKYLIAEIYGKMNNLKSASSKYYQQLFDFMENADTDTKMIFDAYKTICKSIAQQTSHLKFDSLAMLENKLQTKLELANVKWHSKIEIDEIKAVLKDNAIFMDFYWIDEQNKDKTMCVFLTTKDTTIYHEYQDLTQNIDQHMSASNYTNNGEKNKQLYNYLMSPLVGHLKGKSKIYLSTDGVLNQIALEILSPTGKKTDMLTNVYDAIYVENANALIHMSDKSSHKSKFVVVGGIKYDCFADPTSIGGSAMTLANRSDEFQYLEGSHKEAQALSAKLSDANIEYSLLLGCEATKSKLMYNILQKGVTHLHISTHGFVQNANDGDASTYSTYNNYSNILMAKDNPSDDPQLSAVEIIHNNLNAIDLVFVSACNTGKGLYKPGFGNASIANAFMRAGVKKVVATLWPIPDKITTELCHHFYAHYLTNKDANEAMRFAKDKLKVHYSPEQWAAFRVMN